MALRKGDLERIDAAIRRARVPRKDSHVAADAPLVLVGMPKPAPSQPAPVSEVRLRTLPPSDLDAARAAESERMPRAHGKEKVPPPGLIASSRLP